jgi:hypothetical protein
MTMHKSEIALHYAYIKSGGKHYRILASNFPQLIAGHETSDIFGFFGLGSGEFWGPRIEGLEEGVSVVEIPNTEGALMLWRESPRFIGFIDAEPHHRPMVILKGGDKSVYELPINWEVYTQLGDKLLATDMLRTLSRRWCCYPTPEEYDSRLSDILRLVNLF